MAFLCLTAIIHLDPPKSYSQTPATVAASQLVKRIMPQFAGQIVFEQMVTPGDSDIYQLQSKDGKIIILGNGANSMAVGLNHYLKYY